jgi:hypothetical protein
MRRMAGVRLVYSVMFLMTSKCSDMTIGSQHLNHENRSAEETTHGTSSLASLSNSHLFSYQVVRALKSLGGEVTRGGDGGVKPFCPRALPRYIQYLQCGTDASTKQFQQPLASPANSLSNLECTQPHNPTPVAISNSLPFSEPPTWGPLLILWSLGRASKKWPQQQRHLSLRAIVTASTRQSVTAAKGFYGERKLRGGDDVRFVSN